MRRQPVAVLLLCVSISAGTLSAQMPRGFWAWWSRPQIARDLNLSQDQRQQIRATIRQYRPQLMSVRGEMNQAEQALTEEFNRSPVDPGKTNAAIERLANARSDLTRTISQLSLKLRLILTEQQWQELQRRRPAQREDSPAPPESGELK